MWILLIYFYVGLAVGAVIGALIGGWCASRKHDQLWADNFALQRRLDRISARGEGNKQWHSHQERRHC